MAHANTARLSRCDEANVAAQAAAGEAFHGAFRPPSHPAEPCACAESPRAPYPVSAA
jgi:hypothetical protein